MILHDIAATSGIEDPTLGTCRGPSGTHLKPGPWEGGQRPALGTLTRQPTADDWNPRVESQLPIILGYIGLFMGYFGV